MKLKIDAGMNNALNNLLSYVAISAIFFFINQVVLSLLQSYVRYVHTPIKNNWEIYFFFYWLNRRDAW